MKNIASVLMLTVFGVQAAADQGAAGQAAPEVFQWKYLLITGLVPLAISVAKIVIPKIPKSWLPIIAPLMGAFIDILLSGAFSNNTVLAAIAGSAGVGLREIVDQMRKAASTVAAFDNNIKSNNG